MQEDNRAVEKTPSSHQASGPSDDNSDPSDNNNEHFLGGFEGYKEEQIEKIMETFKRVWDLEGPIRLVVPAFNIKKFKLLKETEVEIEQKITKHGNLAYRSDFIACSMIERILLLFADFREVHTEIDSIVVRDLEEFADSNLICFGGDGGNQIVEKLLQMHKIKNPFTTMEKDGVEVCQVTWEGQTYTPRIDNEGNLLSDYGMIYKRRSRLTQKKRYIYIFAGGKSYATQSSAAALTIADIVYKVFCEAGIGTEEFSLPVEVRAADDRPLFTSTSENLVRILKPDTWPPRENSVASHFSFAYARSQLWEKGLDREIVGNATAGHSVVEKSMSYDIGAVITHDIAPVRIFSIWKALLTNGKILLAKGRILLAKGRILLAKGRELIQYIRGYRTLPVLKASSGMAGTDMGFKDFFRFLLGYRSYRKIEIHE